MSVHGFRDSLRSYVPLWMQDRPGLRVAFQTAYAYAELCDRGMQAALEGIRATWPGFDSRTDNLELLGLSRGLVQGETETAAAFTVDLKNWLTIVQDMGGDVGLAKRLRSYLAGNPQVRIISRAQPASPLNPSGLSLYTTITAAGAVSQTYAAWDWDSHSNPERNAGGPGSVGRFDMWIVVYPTTSSVYPWTSYVATTGHWGDGQEGPGTTHGIGLTITQNEVDTVLALVRAWRGGHATPRTLIWSYDAAAFDPATPSRSGNPNGWQGRWFRSDTGLASRNPAHRYSSLGPERP